MTAPGSGRGTARRGPGRSPSPTSSSRRPTACTQARTSGGGGAKSTDAAVGVDSHTHAQHGADDPGLQPRRPQHAPLSTTRKTTSRSRVPSVVIWGWRAVVVKRPVAVDVCLSVDVCPCCMRVYGPGTAAPSRRSWPSLTWALHLF